MPKDGGDEVKNKHPTLLFSWIIHKCTSDHKSFGYKQVKAALSNLRTPPLSLHQGP